MDHESMMNIELAKLAKMGIRFKIKEEARAFASIITEELEVRIGEAIASQLTLEQRLEIEKCENEAEFDKWYEENCPDNSRIVEEKMQEIEQEIIRYKDRIPGVLSCAAE